jgi:hypothetical protein
MSIRACLNNAFRRTIGSVDQKEMARLGGIARWKGISKRKRRELTQAAINKRWDAERKRAEDASYQRRKMK